MDHPCKHISYGFYDAPTLKNCIMYAFLLGYAVNKHVILYYSSYVGVILIQYCKYCDVGSI